jgi:HYDIN/CFA65/VesB family protein
MLNPRRLPISLVILGILIQSFGCECGTQVTEVASRADLYFIDTDQQPPGTDQYLATPESGEIAIDFGATDVGAVNQRYLLIHNTGKSDLILTNLSLAADWDPDFSVFCRIGGQYLSDCPDGNGDGLSIEPNQDLAIRINYAPQALEIDSASFVLSLNAADHPTLTISLLGEGVARQIQVCIADCIGDESETACQTASQLCDHELPSENLAIEFGDLVPQEAHSRLVTIRNSGDRELTVSSLRILGGDYAHFSWHAIQGELPGIIASGQEGIVEIEYLPSSGGQHDSSLQIQSDAGAVEVGLQGRLLAPCVCPEPLSLDFGTVALGEPKQMSFSLTNCGLSDLTIESVSESLDCSPDFSLTNLPGFPAILAPETSIEISVIYDPQQHGSDSGGIDIFSNDLTADPDTHLTGTIGLWGNGIVRECQIQATPFVLNFGGVEQLDSYTMQLLVSNQGSDTCQFDSAEITSNSADLEFSITNAPIAGTTFDPGDILIAEVQYSPQNLGQDTGQLEIVGNDVDGLPIPVDLTGEGISEATCDLQVQPVLLQFGAVKPQHTRRLELILSNQGSATCHVTDLELIPSLMSPSDFEITSGPATPFDLARRGQAGDQALIEITFTPDEEGEHAGVVWFHTDDDPDFRVGYGICYKPGLPPQSPEIGDACIGLSGTSTESDIEVVPDNLDFGTVTVGCNSPELLVTVYNMGYFTINVEAIVLDNPNDPNFEIMQAPATAFSLGWAENFEVVLRYHPQDDNSHSNALVIETDDFDIPRFIVPLRGAGTHVVTQTDIFTQPLEDQADVLFVVDNSESMGEEQTALADNFDHFINWAITQNVNFQIGVITTMASGSEWQTGTPPRDIEAGELVAAPDRPKIITNTTPDLINAFAENVHVGTSPMAGTEQGLAAAHKALTIPKINTANAGFLREAAKLYLIFVSDEDDQSDGSLDYYVDFFASIKGPRNHERLDISAIVGDIPDGCQGDGGEADPCSRYVEIASRTGGVFESICTSNWAQSLENIGLDVFGGYQDFPLTRPADPLTISVSVDNLTVDQAGCQGCADGWTYYADSNSVYFGNDVIPIKGARIEISYTTICIGD